MKKQPSVFLWTSPVAAANNLLMRASLDLEGHIVPLNKDMVVVTAAWAITQLNMSKEEVEAFLKALGLKNKPLPNGTSEVVFET